MWDRLGEKYVTDSVHSVLSGILRWMAITLRRKFRGMRFDPDCTEWTYFSPSAVLCRILQTSNANKLNALQETIQIQGTPYRYPKLPTLYFVAPSECTSNSIPHLLASANKVFLRPTTCSRSTAITSRKQCLITRHHRKIISQTEQCIAYTILAEGRFRSKMSRLLPSLA